MTEANGRPRGRRAFQFPIERAPQNTRAILGELLRARRGDLGYPYRTAFRKATGIHEHLASDIEKARRSNFPVEQLTNVARAYEVTYDSIMSAAWGKTDRLEADEHFARLPSLPARAASSQPPPVADFPWAPDSRFLSADELADAAPEATVFLAAVSRAQELGLNPDDLDGAELFPDDPRRALAWDTVSQWPWQYGIWMAARGLRKAHAARGRQSSRRGSGI